MKISLSWIEELLGAKLNQSPQELSQILINAGFQTASIEKFAKCTGIVSAQILEISKHPNADRLRIVKVTDGKETLNVVCGAPNVQVGQKVFWAKIGSVLADGTKISETAIRSVKSPGMLCSTRELGVGEDQSGLWTLNDHVQIGASLEELVPLEDTILDLEITPNRPDCLSHIGIARELSAVLNLKKPEPSFLKSIKYDDLKLYPVEIESPSDCPRYIGKKIEGISIMPSPLTVQVRLIRCGIRPISNLVDITNYILLETGQPLHVFDADKLEGGKIIVRRAKQGEKILALDGKTYSLTPDVLIIADASKPAAIAGIMGGEETAVTASTKNVVLESAVFDRKLIRSARTRLNLISESSHRFERGVSSWSCWKGSLHAELMIHQLAKGSTTAFSDSLTPDKKSVPSVNLSIEKIEKILGLKIQPAEIKTIFQKLDIEIITSDNEEFLVRPPDWRLDLALDVDFIEEMARLAGYSKIPSTGTKIQLPSEKPVDPASLIKEKIRNVLQSAGFQEALNYGLISPKLCGRLIAKEILIELENPLSEEQSVLRPTLAVELLKNLKQNLAYQKKDIRLFEIGTIFQKYNSQTIEKNFAAGAACGFAELPSWQNQKPQSIDFFWIKGIVEQILRFCGTIEFKLETLDSSNLDQNQGDSVLFPNLSVLLHPAYGFVVQLPSTKTFGYSGLLHPKLCKELDLLPNTVIFELDLDSLAQHAKQDKKIIPPFRTPAIRRDCSILLSEETAWEDLLKEIRTIGGELLEDCVLFDLYGEKETSGRKSLSFTLTFRHPEKTLDDETANQLRDKILAQLNKKFKAELRQK